MTLSNALMSTGLAMRVYNEFFFQVVKKSGGSFFVGRKDRRVTTSPFPYDDVDTWQILNSGPTSLAISRSLEQVA